MWNVEHSYERDIQKIPTTMTKPLIPKRKVQKLITEIGGGW